MELEPKQSQGEGRRVLHTPRVPGLGPGTKDEGRSDRRQRPCNCILDTEAPRIPGRRYKAAAHSAGAGAATDERASPAHSDGEEAAEAGDRAPPPRRRRGAATSPAEPGREADAGAERRASRERRRRRSGAPRERRIDPRYSWRSGHRRYKRSKSLGQRSNVRGMLRRELRGRRLSWSRRRRRGRGGGHRAIAG